MRGHLRQLIVLHWLLASATTVSAQDHEPPIAGIDHIPTVVANLDRASAAFRELGFTLKPGRFHENGLRNSHVKFADGSGIELISPPSKPTDELTARYIALLRAGDGPAFVSLHVRDQDKLRIALKGSGLKIKTGSNGLALEEPLLDFLFFVDDNRSPTDKPEHFAHSNSAMAMTGVRLALDSVRLQKLRILLLALGARVSTQSVDMADVEEATVFTVENGRIVVLSADHQLSAGRPVVGAEFRVRDIRQTTCGHKLQATASASVCYVPAPRAHGLLIEFHE